MSKKVMLIKKNLAPAAKPLGVNPQDPWSTKANITEASEKELLHRFLKAKGINPDFVAKDTKIAHSKSGEFLKWRRDHEFEEQTVVSPTLQHHKALEKRSKVLGNIGPAQQKYSMHEEIENDIDLMLELLEYAIAEGIYTDDEEIARHLVKKYGKNVDAHHIQLARHFHPEKHKTTPERIAKHVNRLLGKPVTEATKPTALDRFRAAAAEREKKHAEIEKKQSKDGSGMTSAIDRLEKHLNKEEKSSGVSKKKETEFHKKLDTLVHSTFGKRKDEMKEDIYQDSQASTQTPSDMGTTANQTEPTYSRRKEMSKSARIIKSIYKKKGVVKEDMYDHEKEDKSVQTYGKKPKMNMTDKKDSFGEEKPDAAAIMTGGTTMTGEKRDDVEIDPMMRNKPGQNTFDKGFGKKGS
jgi:hypothetical protein